MSSFQVGSGYTGCNASFYRYNLKQKYDVFYQKCSIDMYFKALFGHGVKLQCGGVRDTAAGLDSCLYRRDTMSAYSTVL